MVRLKSYACGKWEPGSGTGQVLRHAVTGQEVAAASSEGLDFKAMLDYGRSLGGPLLRKKIFPERAGRLEQMTEGPGGHPAGFPQIAAALRGTTSHPLLGLEGGNG